MDCFCDFRKITFCNFSTFFSFDKSSPLIFQMCFMRRAIALLYLCPNMIHFDAVDFSERRSEEVMSFF